MCCSSTNRPSRQFSAHRRTQLRIPEVAQPGQRRGHGADTDPGLASDSHIGRIELASAVVQEVEDQRGKHVQRGWADGATMPARLVGAAVESRARCQRRTAAFFGIGWKRTFCVVLSDHTGHAAWVEGAAGRAGATAVGKRGQSELLLGCAEAVRR